MKSIFQIDFKSAGFSLIELLIAISFISVMITLVLSVESNNNKLRYLNEERTQSLFYSTEAMEAIKLMDWNDLTAGDYSVSLVSNAWILASGSQLMDNKYTRTISIANVYRANSSNGHSYGKIVTSGGYLDPDTKKVNVNVVWNSSVGTSKQENLETYLHRWKAERWNQHDWVGGSGQTTWSDVTMFTNKDLGVDISISGIATLQSGFIDWSNATTTANFDTPGNFDDNDVYEINGYAYLVTENNSSGSEFYILDVSDIYKPIQIAELDIGASVNAVVVQNNYAYLSTNDNNAELQVVDVSNKYSPNVVETYNLPDNDNAKDLVVDISELYIVQEENLYSLSISDPENVQYLDDIKVDKDANEIFLSADYIYVATEDNDKELQIFDVTNPANLDQVGEYDLPGHLKATDVFVLGNAVYISTKNNGSGAEFFILDISDPSKPVYLGEYEVGESVHSLAVVGPYALIGTNFLNDELTVIDISVPASPSIVSSFDLTGYVLGMSANCSVIYAATSSNDGEFFIISTEVTDCEYSDYGTLESSTFDTGSSQVTYNWIAFTGSQPVDTDIYFQIATSNNPNGPWTFRGPDGNTSSYYTVSAQEFINYSQHLNQRYIRYKLFLKTMSSLEVPILEEVSISYSTYP